MAIVSEKIASVGVITRTKNRPKLLRRCVESILSQTFNDWTHVIVNDGGNAEDIATVLNSYGDDYKARSILLNHEKCRGMEAASNTGLRELKTDFVAFLDDDDTWHREFLFAMISSLRRARSDTVKGIVCQTEIVHETLSNSQIVEDGRWPFNGDLKLISLADLLVGNRFTNNSFLFERSVVEKIGFFDEQLEALGDWDFNLRFFFEFDAIVLDKTLARWHWREKTVNSSDANSIYDARNIHFSARIKLLNDALRGKRFSGQQSLPIISILGGKLDKVTTAVEAALMDRIKKVDALQAQISALQAQISALQASTSWRITSPLRAMKKMLDQW